jgi:cytochrome c peroxidase
MKKAAIIAGMFISITGYFLLSCKQPVKIVPEKAIEQTLLAQIDSFSFVKNKFLAAAESGTANEKQLQQLFLQTRLAYKKFEWATEYFTSSTTRFVNGPPVPEIGITGNQVFAPEGLQVIETFLFPKYDATKRKELIRQLKLLQSRCDTYTAYFNNIEIFNWQIFDAAKLEVFRILTLGISGFDTPLLQNSMQEAATSLKSLQTVLAYYTDNEDRDGLMDKLKAATAYLQKNTGFNAFNRAAFITMYGNGITISISNLQNRLNLPVIKYNRLLRQDAKTLFDKDAFNVNAYAPDLPYFVTDKKIALGKKLFSDPVLSIAKTRSCASCHQPDKAFTDGLTKNTIINNKILLKRNTPTLLNAALQPAQFYDMRANTLEDQVLDVVQNKQEMHGSIKLAIKQIWQNQTYRQLFSDAFPKPGRKGIDTLEVTNAISSYIRSLTLLNSRFDEYMRGNKTAMSQSEINGFNLFMGKAKCATCHYMPLFNGTFPPRYLITETEVIGVPGSKTVKTLDTDMGRFSIVNIDPFKHAFKTTTVRNAARTAPYMHNGVFTTLNEVMDFYNKGGGVGMGLKIENQTLSADKLNLTTTEVNDVIAFIKSLNSN